MNWPVILALATAMTHGIAVGPATGQMNTLDSVRQRGSLNCGVNSSLPGFSQSDGRGTWRGFDVDYCKAIAAAVLGDAAKVTYLPIPRLKRFASLRSGTIDVLIRNTTWTSTRDTDGLSFVAVTYHDGQGFMAKSSRGVRAIKDLNGATICVGTGTTSEVNLADYFAANNLTYKPLSFPTHAETVQAYLADRCQAYSADAASLYSVRVEQARPKDHLILPDLISKEPLGPAIREGDVQWFKIIRWVHFALITAEELGVSHANVKRMLSSTNPQIKRLLGIEGEFGKALGLEPDFAVKVLKAVGNYGEVFESNLGTGSRMKIERGINRLWNDGGLHYAPPIR